MTRAEKVVVAQELRAQGLLLREIGERMGAPLKTVSAWLSDPDLSKQQARRVGYQGRCADCGAPTDGSGGRAATSPERCVECYRLEIHFKACDQIIAAIRDFATRYGRPPAATDWNPHAAVRLGQAETAARFYDDGCWPYTSGVLSVFGSWNAAIIAAGMTPRPVGTYGRPGEDPAFCQQVRKRYEAGASSTALAREYGCTAETIRQRIKRAGGQMRSPGPMRVAA